VRRTLVLPGADLTSLEGLAQRGQLGARLLHVDIDRVEPLDHRERIRLAGTHEGADRCQRAADPPADRRGNRGVAQVDPCSVERGRVLRDSARAAARLRRGVGVILRRNRLDLGKGLVTVRASDRRVRAGARTGEVCLGLVDCRAVKARVDLVERLSPPAPRCLR
jgi:hypothetical protein